jgi:hypothetical protein
MQQLEFKIITDVITFNHIEKTKILYFHGFFSPSEDSIARIIKPELEKNSNLQFELQELDGHSNDVRRYRRKTISSMYKKVEEEILEEISSLEDNKIKNFFIFATSGGAYLAQTTIDNLTRNKPKNQNLINGIGLFHPVTNINLAMKNSTKREDIVKLLQMYRYNNLGEFLKLKEFQTSLNKGKELIGTPNNPFNFGNIPVMNIYSEKDEIVTLENYQDLDFEGMDDDLRSGFDYWIAEVSN